MTTRLSIVTPHGAVFEDDVQGVVLPGSEGDFGVLPGHTPFLAALGVGEVSYRADGARHYLACFGGFCEVLPDRVTVLADVGERAEDIDLERAEKQAGDSSARLAALTEEEGYAEARASHQRNLTRQAVARKRR